jgi:glycosyltransferase involved in cell wall biosynthesis
VPTYQRRELVQRAVTSVLAQTYRDLELIVIDDGSTDGTGQALAPLAGRIRYRWQPNRGVSAARNAALWLAGGSIVAFLDSDDRWLPEHVETVVAMLKRHPEAVLASTCIGHHIGGREDAGQARVVDALPSMLATLGLAGYTSGIAVRRDPLVAVGGFDERLTVAEDHHLWLRLAGRGRFCFVRRRTIVRQSTKGSLIDRGIRAGTYPRSFELIAEAGISEAERRGRGDCDLAIQARGARQYARALRALAGSDREGARFAFFLACQDLPELAHQPDQVANRVRRLGGGRATRLHHFAAAATCWPDPHCDTALYLRVSAITLALRAGQPGAALRLVAGWPLRFTLGFLLRNLRLWGRLLRRGFQARLYRGREQTV